MSNRPIAHCQLTQGGEIAFFDGKPMVMTGPVGNEHHPTPLYSGEILDKIDRKAEAGLCYFTLSSAREFLKDIREIVATAQGKEYTR